MYAQKQFHFQCKKMHLDIKEKRLFGTQNKNVGPIIYSKTKDLVKLYFCKLYSESTNCKIGCFRAENYLKQVYGNWVEQAFPRRINYDKLRNQDIILQSRCHYSNDGGTFVLTRRSCFNKGHVPFTTSTTQAGQDITVQYHHWVS